MIDPVLAYEAVRFRHVGGQRDALDGVALALAAGETVVVLGASGAGKSTLCLAANGLIPHFLKGELSGRVLVGGRDTREHQPRTFAPFVGVIFQDFESQLFCTTAELEAAFGPENLGLPREEIRRRVDDALARTGLGGLARRMPATLSGGQKQRLVLAAALTSQPQVLVLDEPTSDLDPRGKAEVHAVARALSSGRHATALLIAEPEADEAVQADRVVVLREGRVALSGPPGEVLTRLDDLHAAGIPAPAAAAITGRLGLAVTIDPGEAAARITAAGYRIRAATPAASPAEVGAPALLAVRDLTYSYPGGAPVLDRVDLEIRAGELVAILGQNGSGKSTLAKLLAGLLPAPANSVLIGGRCAREFPRAEAGRRVGFVFQNPDHQIFAETVEAEIAFGPRLQGLDTATVRARVEEALAAVGLLGKGAADPFLLSKGERQRVAVASVLATRPEALILDEPTTGLDHEEIRETMALVDRLNRAGHAVVIITHAMWVAAEYARRIVVMAGGRVIADGAPRSVFHDDAVLAAAAIRAPAAAAVARRLGSDAVSVQGVLDALVRD
jgi:energy-coupling factor transport system ATP-binding protein